MKKLLSATLAVALVFGASSAVAQNMHVLAGPQGAPPTTVVDLPAGLPFDVFIMLDTGTFDASAAEFVVTELTQAVPGTYRIGKVKINATPLDVGNNDLGEYVMSFSGCFAPGLLEMVKLSYVGAMPADTVLELRGLQQDDTQPSSFFGELGFIDCENVGHATVMGGTDGGTTGSGVVFPDGSCVLNPTPIPVPTADGSVGQLKARF